MCFVITGTSPVTYTGLIPQRYRFIVRAFCPDQRVRDGGRRRMKFRISE